MPENKMTVKGFFLHFEQVEALTLLPPEKIKGVLQACLDFCTGKEPDLSDSIIRGVFLLLRPSILKKNHCERDVSQKEWAELRIKVFKRDNYTCRYCGKRGHKLECDHVIPFSRGGLSVLDNLVTACKSCIRSKGAKSLNEWQGRK